jgi:hypothetical protein
LWNVRDALERQLKSAHHSVVDRNEFMKDEPRAGVDSQGRFPGLDAEVVHRFDAKSFHSSSGAGWYFRFGEHDAIWFGPYRDADEAKSIRARSELRNGLLHALPPKAPPVTAKTTTEKSVLIGHKGAETWDAGCLVSDGEGGMYELPPRNAKQNPRVDNPFYASHETWEKLGLQKPGWYFTKSIGFDSPALVAVGPFKTSGVAMAALALYKNTGRLPVSKDMERILRMPATGEA